MCDVREFSRFMCVFDLDATHGKKIFTPAEICCGNYSYLFETGGTVRELERGSMA